MYVGCMNFEGREITYRIQYEDEFFERIQNGLRKVCFRQLPSFVVKNFGD